MIESFMDWGWLWLVLGFVAGLLLTGSVAALAAVGLLDEIF